jgi:hypothetical protein
MTIPGVSVLDASFVLAVVGGAQLPAPWAGVVAAIIGAGYFAVAAALHYRNPPEAKS